MTRAIVAVALFLFVSVAPASAQRAYRLTLEKPTALKSGRIVVIGGVADPKGHRTFIENLSVLQPVDVALVTLGQGDDVELALAKDNWDAPVQAASTKGGGVVNHKLRTEGEMRFVVKAKGEPKPYRLVVWVGDPVQLPVRSALVTRANSRSRWALYGGVALAVLFAGGVGVWALRRKRPAAMVVLLVMSATVIRAQGGAPSRADAAPFLGGGTGEWAERAADLSGMFGWDSPSTALDWWKEHRGFTPEDDSYVPDFNPDGTPDLPVGCGLDEGSADACRSCYTDAQADMNNARLQLERLRALYESTDRYVEKSIAFGDNVSGIHGASGLAWQAQRKGIMTEFEKFERTHESKRQDLMKSLRTSLDAVAACEAQYFENQDWFNRYGFMYYQFMEARYRK